jgi:hypothetical protein
MEGLDQLPQVILGKWLGELSGGREGQGGLVGVGHLQWLWRGFHFVGRVDGAGGVHESGLPYGGAHLRYVAFLSPFIFGRLERAEVMDGGGCEFLFGFVVGLGGKWLGASA